MKKEIQFFVLLFIFAFSVKSSTAQITAIAPPDAIAYLSVNGEKTGGGTGTIYFSTSFFIKHIVMSDTEKQKHINAVLNAKQSFTKLEINNITESNDANDKGFMVIVDLTAGNNEDLTNKIKFLLNELNVKNVNYNGTFYKTTDFKF